MAPVMWLGIMAFYEYCCAPEGYARYMLYLLLGSLFFSVLILPDTPLTPYIFMPVLFCALFITAKLYSSVMEKAGLRAALAFMLFTSFSVKYLMLSYLNPFISAPVAFCFALYMAVSRQKPDEYYAEENNAIRAMAPFYIVLMAQCVAAAVLKNRIFF